MKNKSSKEFQNMAERITTQVCPCDQQMSVFISFHAGLHYQNDKAPNTKMDYYYYYYK